VDGAEQQQAGLGGQCRQEARQQPPAGPPHPLIDVPQVQALVAAQGLRPGAVEVPRLIEEAGPEAQLCPAARLASASCLLGIGGPAGARLTWVVEDLRGGEEAGRAGELPQGAVCTGQLRRVRQDGGQALTGLTTGACGHRAKSARRPWVQPGMVVGTQVVPTAMTRAAPTAMPTAKPMATSTPVPTAEPSGGTHDGAHGSANGKAHRDAHGRAHSHAHSCANSRAHGRARGNAHSRAHSRTHGRAHCCAHGSPSPSRRCESPMATLMGEKSRLASGWAASAMRW